MNPRHLGMAPKAKANPGVAPKAKPKARTRQWVIESKSKLMHLNEYLNYHHRDNGISWNDARQMWQDEINNDNFEISSDNEVRVPVEIEQVWVLR